MNLYPFGTERSSLLGTEAFRNLLGEALKNSKKCSGPKSPRIRREQVLGLPGKIRKKS